MKSNGLSSIFQKRPMMAFKCSVALSSPYPLHVAYSASKSSTCDTQKESHHCHETSALAVKGSTADAPNAP